MADQPSSSTTRSTYYCYSSKSIFISPKFRFLSSKMTPFESDFSLPSPTSILEANPSILSSKSPKPHRFQPPDAFGLADLVENRDRDHWRKPEKKMVLFGSKLRVQIPSADFGTKTGVRYDPAHGLSPCLQPKVLTVSVSEIDQTEEDYTRVISHGPNPTITHIFDNSVFVEATTPCSVPLPPKGTEAKTNFLSYCGTCNKNLDHKQDIYIYRGDKGFCSSECRYQEMRLDQIES